MTEKRRRGPMPVILVTENERIRAAEEKARELRRKMNQSGSQKTLTKRTSQQIEAELQWLQIANEEASKRTGPQREDRGKRKPTTEQLERFFDLISIGKINRGNLQRFLENPNWREDEVAAGQAAAAAERTRSSVPPAIKAELTVIGTFTVDHSAGKNLNGGLLATRFDKISDIFKEDRFTMISRCASANRGKIVICKLTRMNRAADKQDVLVEMDKLNLLPATHDEIIDFVLQHPAELRKRRAIIGLGSVYEDGEGISHVACAGTDRNGSYLGSEWETDIYDEGTCFLAVEMES